MRRVLKYGTGQEIPKGAIYLKTVVQEIPRKLEVERYVWHYFLVEEKEVEK